MMIGLSLTNGIVFGFEFSTRFKMVQFHLSFFSLVVVWGLDDEGGFSSGVDE